MDGSSGDDTLVEEPSVPATVSATLIGDLGTDTLQGGAGDDTLDGSLGQGQTDLLYGGPAPRRFGPAMVDGTITLSVLSSFSADRASRNRPPAIPLADKKAAAISGFRP